MKNTIVITALGLLALAACNSPDQGAESGSATTATEAANAQTISLRVTGMT